MPRRTRGVGEDIPEQAALLRDLGEARRALIQASTRVRPMGATYHALSMVLTSIEALAHYLTGQPSYYAVTGSVPPAGDPHVIPARPDDGDEPEG